MGKPQNKDTFKLACEKKLNSTFLVDSPIPFFSCYLGWKYGNIDITYIISMKVLKIPYFNLSWIRVKMVKMWENGEKNKYGKIYTFSNINP